jgi:hypothetical protein
VRRPSFASLGHDVEEAAPTFDQGPLEPLARVWAIANLESYRAAERWLGRPPRRDELEITIWELVEHARQFGVISTPRGRGAAAQRVLQRYDAAHRRSPPPSAGPERSQGGAKWWRFDWPNP